MSVPIKPQDADDIIQARMNTMCVCVCVCVCVLASLFALSITIATTTAIEYGNYYLTNLQMVAMANMLKSQSP